ncbi:MAG TPA: DUF6252 family protein [Flavobacterium sp.]|nr:DUF6252 family protein [Flavobacterium sp.]
MTKLKFIAIAAVFFAAFGMSSCEDEPVDPAIPLNPTTPIIPGTASFKVDFDAQTYIATQVDAVISDGQISISAYKGAELESFNISLDGTATGSYLANEHFLSYSPGFGEPELYVAVNPDDDTDNTGQVTITTIDPVTMTMSGTFNFTGYDEDVDGNITTKEFTNGVFTNIPYTQ